MRLIFLVRVTTPKLPLYSKFWSIYSVTLLQNEKFYEIGSSAAGLNSAYYFDVFHKISIVGLYTIFLLEAVVHKLR